MYDSNIQFGDLLECHKEGVEFSACHLVVKFDTDSTMGFIIIHHHSKNVSYSPETLGFSWWFMG